MSKPNRCSFKVSIGGRVKDLQSKQAIARKIGDIGSTSLIDLETGAFKAKKAKKQKTPEENAMADVKTLEKKLLVNQHCTKNTL